MTVARFVLAYYPGEARIHFGCLEGTAAFFESLGPEKAAAVKADVERLLSEAHKVRAVSDGDSSPFGVSFGPLPTALGNLSREIDRAIRAHAWGGSIAAFTIATLTNLPAEKITASWDDGANLPGPGDP